MFHLLQCHEKKDESSHLSFVKICKYAGFLLTLAAKNVDLQQTDDVGFRPSPYGNNRYKHLVKSRIPSVSSGPFSFYPYSCIAYMIMKHNNHGCIFIGSIYCISSLLVISPIKLRVAASHVHWFVFHSRKIV